MFGKSWKWLYFKTLLCSWSETLAYIKLFAQDWEQQTYKIRYQISEARQLCPNWITMICSMLYLLLLSDVWCIAVLTIKCDFQRNIKTWFTVLYCFWSPSELVSSHIHKKQIQFCDLRPQRVQTPRTTNWPHTDHSIPSLDSLQSRTTPAD